MQANYNSGETLEVSFILAENYLTYVNSELIWNWFASYGFSRYGKLSQTLIAGLAFAVIFIGALLLIVFIHKKDLKKPIELAWWQVSLAKHFQNLCYLFSSASLLLYSEPCISMVGL